MKNQLIRLAKKSPHPLHKHATIVIRGGAVIAVGYNHDGIHSEIVALSKLWPSKRRGCSIINIRIRRSGTIGISDPCVDCSIYLFKYGIKKVKVIL